MAPEFQPWPDKIHMVIRIRLRMRAGMHTVRGKAETVIARDAVAGMKMTTLSAQLILTRRRVPHTNTLRLTVLITREHIMAGMQRSRSEVPQLVP